MSSDLLIYTDWLRPSTYYYVPWRCIQDIGVDRYQDRSLPAGASRAAIDSPGSLPEVYIVMISIRPSCRIGMYHPSQHY